MATSQEGFRGHGQELGQLELGFQSLETDSDKD